MGHVSSCITCHGMTLVTCFPYVTNCDQFFWNREQSFWVGKIQNILIKLPSYRIYTRKYIEYVFFTYSFFSILFQTGFLTYSIFCWKVKCKMEKRCFVQFLCAFYVYMKYYGRKATHCLFAIWLPAYLKLLCSTCQTASHFHLIRRERVPGEFKVFSKNGGLEFFYKKLAVS